MYVQSTYLGRSNLDMYTYNLYTNQREENRKRKFFLMNLNKI